MCDGMGDEGESSGKLITEPATANQLIGTEDRLGENLLRTEKALKNINHLTSSVTAALYIHTIRKFSNKPHKPTVWQPIGYGKRRIRLGEL